MTIRVLCFLYHNENAPEGDDSPRDFWEDSPLYFHYSSMERPDILCHDYLRDNIFRKMEAGLDVKAGSTRLLP